MTHASTKTTLGVLLGMLVSTAAWATSEANLESAYRSARGELLVVIAGDAGRSVFWGKETELHQLEILGQAPASAETTLSFYRGLGAGSGKELSGEITLEASSARVDCDARDGTEGFTPLSPDEVRVLETGIRKGKTKVSGLPEILEPLYLFEAGKELVLVMAPVFNFRGDFRVLMGPKGHLKSVAVDHARERVSEAEQGHIRFSRGGGLFIPLTIDLQGREGNRGSPTLIRSEGAAIEALSMPHLPRGEIERLGFGKSIRAPLHNPCDRGRVALVGPRSL